jgi:hypothetical protein
LTCSEEVPVGVPGGVVVCLHAVNSPNAHDQDQGCAAAIVFYSSDGYEVTVACQ